MRITKSKSEVVSNGKERVHEGRTAKHVERDGARGESQSGRKKKKEKPPFDRGIVILVFVVNLLVLAGSFYIVFQTGVEPSTTVMAWFGFAGAEVWALALLKTNKRKSKIKEEQMRKEEEI